MYPGISFEHVGATRRRTEEGAWIQEFGIYVSKVLELPSREDCNASPSPKLDKAQIDGDDDPCEQAALFRTAVCTLLRMSKL